MFEERDPSKFSMWVETYLLRNHKKSTYINLQCHEYYNNPKFEGLIRRLIVSVTKQYETYNSVPYTSILRKDISHIE